MGTLLVTGAGGQLGRRVVTLLLDAGTGNVVATTRDPRKLAELAAHGVTVRRLDYGNADNHGPALAGVERLLLVSTDLVDAPGIRLRQQTALIDAAVRAGVQHIVYTSMTRPGPGSRFPYAIDHDETEQHLAASAVAWTVLRNNRYMETLPQVLRPALASGELATLTAEGACAYVARDDCALVAAAVLLRPPPGNLTLDVSGPATVSYSELAQIAAEAGRRPIGLKLLPEAVRRGSLIAAGLTPVAAALALAPELAAADGHLAGVSDTVAALTGRQPQSVRDFIAAHPGLLHAPAGDAPLQQRRERAR